MHTVLVLQHSLLRPPAWLGDYLARAGCASFCILLRDGEDLPDWSLIERMAGMVVLDADDGAGTEPPWRDEERALLARAHLAGLPLLGLGGGAVLIARALGAEQSVEPAPVVGWLPAMLRPEAAEGPWLACLGPHAHTVFFHQFTAMEPPPGALGLLSGPGGGVAAFAIQRALGLRFHPELSRAALADWLPELTAHLPPPSPTVQRGADLHRDIESRLAAMRRAAEALFSAWVAELLETGEPARNLQVTPSTAKAPP